MSKIMIGTSNRRNLFIITVLFLLTMFIWLAPEEAHAENITVDSNTTTWQSGNVYYVRENVTINERVSVKGRVNLIIEEGAELHALRGIGVRNGNELSIEGHGKLYADGKKAMWSGIGADNTQDRNDHGGDININTWPGSSVSVEARGGEYGAGIGASDLTGFEGNITIDGGYVLAVGGTNAAGIGAARWGNAREATITINGGTVIAMGNGGGAGIGAGIYKDNREAFATLERLDVILPHDEARYREAYERWKSYLSF